MRIPFCSYVSGPLELIVLFISRPTDILWTEEQYILQVPGLLQLYHNGGGGPLNMFEAKLFILTNYKCLTYQNNDLPCNTKSKWAVFLKSLYIVTIKHKYFVNHSLKYVQNVILNNMLYSQLYYNYLMWYVADPYNWLFYVPQN